MNELREQIARAQRRLVLEQFLARSVWCLFAALAVAAVAIAVPRVDLSSRSLLPAHWDYLWLRHRDRQRSRRRRRLDDDLAPHRARRRDRNRSPLRSPRARRQQRVALRSRAKHRSRAGAGERRRSGREPIDVGDKFRVQLSRRAWLPLVPAVLAFLLMTFVNPPDRDEQSRPQSPAAIAKQINTAAEAARKKLEEQRKQAERDDLKEAEGLFKRIEAGTSELAEKKDLDRTKAAVKLNDLAKQLEQRRKQLGGKDGLQKQLQNLKSLGSGAAEKIAQAMKQGDFKQAAEEIEKLAKHLRDGKLDAKGKAELAKQLDEMKKKLAAAADAHRTGDGRSQEANRTATREGDLAKAGELQQKLDQLAAQRRK